MRFYSFLSLSLSLSLCAMLSISREEFHRSAFSLTHTLIVMPRTHGWPITFLSLLFLRVHGPEQVVIKEVMRSNSRVFLSIYAQMSVSFCTYTVPYKWIPFASILYLSHLNLSLWKDQKWSFNQESEGSQLSGEWRWWAVYLNRILLLFNIHIFIW